MARLTNAAKVDFGFSDFTGERLKSYPKTSESLPGRSPALMPPRS
jgi:hypothetical protein